MRNGDSGPAVPHDVARIGQYLDDANQVLYERYDTDGPPPLARLRKREDAAAILACQAHAARALHLIWWRWLESVAQIRDRRLSYYIEPLCYELLRERWIKAGASADFDRGLRGFFERAGRVIFESSDPPAAMRGFWNGPKRGQGRPPEDHLLDRNLRIACAVAIDMAGRRGNYEAAVRAAMTRENLSKKRSRTPTASTKTMTSCWPRWRRA